VVNIEQRKDISWEEAKNAKATKGVSGTFGYITLKPKYGSAFIIDGQHRLYSYSGHPMSDKSLLSVLAFGGLDAIKQSEMFVDINSEQKNVPRKLLIDLNADLLWDSPDTKKLMQAIGTKVVHGLNDCEPLLERVSLAEGGDTDTKCIGLTAIHKELLKPGFFMEFSKGGTEVPQVFWRKSRTDTVKRTVKVIADWLRRVSEPNQEWWDLGKADGGGLAMSASIATCLGVLRQTVIYLNKENRLVHMSDKKLIEELADYGDALGIYFSEMGANEKLIWRQISPGNQGHTKAVNLGLEAIQTYKRSFRPEGLEAWKDRRKNQTNSACQTVCHDIERHLKTGVEIILKEEFGGETEAWWFEGVPPKVIQAAQHKEIESKGATKFLQNVTLVDYQKIIKNNWIVMRDTFAYGERDNVGKDQGTKWIDEVNQRRNIVAHTGAREEFLGPDDLELLEKYSNWLEKQIDQLKNPHFLKDVSSEDVD